MDDPGRDFILSGPDAEDIASFTRQDALQSIRVYVGRAQEDTAQARVDVALEELQRQVFEHDVT